MLSKAVFKRVVPFLLSFVAGLFIASFFVSLAVPDFSGFRRGPGKMREYRRVKMENEDLRRDNCRLKKELEAARSERKCNLRVASAGDQPCGSATAFAGREKQGIENEDGSDKIVRLQGSEPQVNALKALC
jgi:hypothetical protein